MAGYQSARKLIAGNRLPAALLVTNGYVALGVLEALGVAQRGLDGFTAAAGKHDPLRARHQSLDSLRHLIFERVLRAIDVWKGGAADSSLHRSLVAMAQYQGAPGEDIVHVLVAVDVPKPGTSVVPEIQGNRKLPSEWAADATGERPPGSRRHSARVLIPISQRSAPLVCKALGPHIHGIAIFINVVDRHAQIFVLDAEYR
jgi:hypothetical protein